MFVHFLTDVKSRYNASGDNGESKMSLLIRGITSGYNNQIKENAIKLELKKSMGIAIDKLLHTEYV